MAPGTLFGLIVIAGGVLVILVSRVLTNFAANSQAYLRPGPDKAAFKQRNVRLVRYMGVAWMVLGAGAAIFGLVTGH